MTDTTIHPIPKGTRVNVTKFQHASGMKCTGAPDSPHEVLTIDEIYNEGEYRLRMEGSGLCCHAAFQFVSPYVEPAEDNTPEPAEPLGVTPRQALAIIGSGFVGMTRLGYGSIYESDSGARAIMDGTVPEAVVDALATLGEHGLRNMGGGR